jgi:hypothetical protein
MKTKILLMITIATITMSCKKTEENNTENQNAVTETTVSQAPICGDKEVKEALMSSIQKEGTEYMLFLDEIGDTPIKKIEFNNILTRSQNNDLQKCECEADFIEEFTNGEKRTGHIYYFAQKDSEGNIIVKQQDIPEAK